MTKIYIIFLTSQPNLRFRQFGEHPHHGIRREESTESDHGDLNINFRKGIAQPSVPNEDHHKMNEIDGIAQPGNLTDPPTEATVALPLDAAHQREDCICHDGHVHPTEAPTNFQIGDHRHASQPILKYRHREEIASHQH